MSTTHKQMDKEKRPTTIHYRLSFEVKLLVVVIRTLLGWGAHRISAELERREIAAVSHTSVNKIFHQYHLPTKTYHPKGKSDGVKRRRYRRCVGNELWHLDFKGPIKLLNGLQVYLLIVIDDFSRFCLSIHCRLPCARPDDNEAQLWMDESNANNTFVNLHLFVRCARPIWI